MAARLPFLNAFSKPAFSFGGVKWLPTSTIINGKLVFTNSQKSASVSGRFVCCHRDSWRNVPECFCDPLTCFTPCGRLAARLYIVLPSPQDLWQKDPVTRKHLNSAMPSFGIFGISILYQLWNLNHLQSRAVALNLVGWSFVTGHTTEELKESQCGFYVSSME